MLTLILAAAVSTTTPVGPEARPVGQVETVAQRVERLRVELRDAETALRLERMTKRVRDAQRKAHK